MKNRNNDSLNFQSYCWNIGTTSFRVKGLIYKNEVELQLLDRLYKENPNYKWANLQTKYYDLLFESNLATGTSKNKKKDAREFTSGLVDLGLTTKDRKITFVGEKLLEITSRGDFKTNNIFGIEKNNYLYLLQFLKLQCVKESIEIKPFVSFIYLLEKLEFLTREEFTYLLPLCRNTSELIETCNKLKENRNSININEFIVDRIMHMNNYISALNLFKASKSMDENLFITIGLNRKSPQYDGAMFDVYKVLEEIFLNNRQYSEYLYLQKINELKVSLKGLNSNQAKLWKKYFGFPLGKINVSFISKFNKLSLFDSNNLEEFKTKFFQQWHLIKWKLTLSDYYDLNKRYFMLTNIIRFKDETFTLTEIAKLYFSKIIDEMILQPIVKENYIDYFYNNIDIDKIYPQCNLTTDDLTKLVNDIYGIHIELDELNNYFDKIKNADMLQYVKDNFDDAKLIKLLLAFRDRNDDFIKKTISDDATVPTAFEYVLGIIWYKISGLKGELRNYLKLSLDANFLPISHATGGDADIIFNYDDTIFYPKHDLLLEATLSNSTSQRQMEWEPVTRHLENHILADNNLKDYVVFIANNLERRTVWTFRNQKTAFFGDGKVVHQGLKIIPLDANNLVTILRKGYTYDQLYGIFEEAYNDEGPQNEWHDSMITNKL